MREIKFRAWLTDRKEMVEFTNGGEVELQFNPHGLVSLYIGKYEQTFLLSEFELLSYTGLKDKNGKEIYGGDIISDGKSNLPVSYRRGGFVVSLGEYVPGTGNRFSSLNSWCGGEVIGNIYENPELLEQETL